MRAIAVAQRATDMIAMPAKSRFTQGGSPADKQLVPAFIADSYPELMPFKLAVLHAARLIDTAGEHAARAEIAACKILAARVVQSTALRAIQVHCVGHHRSDAAHRGAARRAGAGSADGPTEAHRVNLARLLLKHYEAGCAAIRSQLGSARNALQLEGCVDNHRQYRRHKGDNEKKAEPARVPEHCAHVGLRRWRWQECPGSGCTTPGIPTAPQCICRASRPR
jgi:Acyl-CoA dehydrogenase, C-terminal domain